MDSELEKLVASGKVTQVVARKISELSEGTFCEHKSWGVGRVKGWDLLGGQLEIDFEGRPGHVMKLEFAANSLKVIPGDHILAQRAGDLEGLKKLAAEDPVELVRRALSSFGDRMSLDAFEELLVGTVISESDFKSWWTATKKKLRKDKQFVVPSRRSEPLEMRGAGVTPVAAMLADFRGATDLKEKAKAGAVILDHLDEFKEAPGELKSVIEEINEVAPKALKLHPLRVVELIAVRDEIVGVVSEVQAEGEGLSMADVLRREQHQMGHMLTALPVSRVRLMLAAFPEAFGEEWPKEAVGLLNKLNMRGIAEVTKYLQEKGEKEILLEFLQRGVRHRDLDSNVLAWMCIERGGVTAALIDDELPVAIMNSLEKHHMDEESRKVNRLHDLLYEDRELLTDLVSGMDLNHVRTFARRLLMTPVFEELIRRSLLARIIKVHPDVQDLVTGEEKEEKEKEEKALIVSWESLEKRKNELEELIKKKIPENSKEIAIARSYGDLKENFEYKAAKQMQAVLMRRKSEYEREVANARGTDFKDAKTETVSVGTVVKLEDTNGGGDLTYTILGAWDGDPERNVVAYLSDVGKELIGKKVGEEVELRGAEEGSAARRMRVGGIEKFAQ